MLSIFTRSAGRKFPDLLPDELSCFLIRYSALGAAARVEVVPKMEPLVPNPGTWDLEVKMCHARIAFVISRLGGRIVCGTPLA
jgi:hypothetical protein